MSRDRSIVRLNEAFLYVDDVFLDLVEQEKKIRRQKHRKIPMAFLGTAAACICLVVVLPAVAMAYNWFGLRELLLQNNAEKSTSFALSEYQASPEIRALTEWKEVLEEYDTDRDGRTGLKQGDFSEESRKDWMLYGVTTPGMGEQLDRIAGKYGLKLHTEKEALGLEALEKMTGGRFIDAACTGEGVIFEDYSFWLEGNMETEACGTFDFRLGYTVKGTLDDRMPLIGNITDYAEWEYRTACGNTVQLVSGSLEALILADSDQCFVTVTLPGENITKDTLQELADQIDFGLLMKGLHIGQSWLDSKLGNGDIISMSGYLSSPESQALYEWQEFLDGYDMDAALGYGNTIFKAEGREDWSLYTVYNYEMGEKLDEIVNRYGLRLYSEIYILEPEELEARVGGSFIKDCNLYEGYLYDDGTFQLSGDTQSEACGEICFQFRRAVKGTFSDVVLSIGEAEGYTEWQYTSGGGETVLLAMNPIKSLIIGDFDNCFIMVNVLAGTNNGMTKEVLQELADKIDFKRIGGVPEQ